MLVHPRRRLHLAHENTGKAIRKSFGFALGQIDQDVRNIGRLLSRHRIYEAVWGANSKVTSRTIDTHVSRIRNKLGLMPSNGWHLKGVYGHGYRLEQVRSDARHEEAA